MASLRAGAGRAVGRAGPGASEGAGGPAGLNRSSMRARREERRPRIRAMYIYGCALGCVGEVAWWVVF